MRDHDVERFKCEICEKVFQVRWRLERHVEAHANQDAKFCHYYNNSKHCPYEDIGCMFQHEDSQQCYFGKSCTNKLCQFKHQTSQRGETADDRNVNINQNKSESIKDANKSDALDDENGDDESDDSDIEDDDNTCVTCGKYFEDVGDLSEHNMNDVCGYGCEPCGAYYRYEKYLKIHLEKHCIKCCDEFSPKAVLEAHKKTCTGMIQYD